MKRIIALILSMLIFTTCLPLETFIVSAQDNSVTKRATALVLDVSGTVSFKKNGEIIYTADSSVENVKKSALKFLDKLEEADGENTVALVVYSGEAEVLSEFTKDISSVKEKVKQIEVRDNRRNINAALKEVDKLLINVAVNATKNVVLVTTGITDTGENEYKGHYGEKFFGYAGTKWKNPDTGIHLSAYANAAYNAARNIEETKNAKLYTLGLFQSMDNISNEESDIAGFFETVARELASDSEKFYSIDNPDDMDFAFGNVAEEINKLDGKFRYAGVINKTYDSVADYKYRDSYFYGSARGYNPSLATMSLCLELSSWTSHNKKKWYNDQYTPDDSEYWEDKICNAKTLLIGKPSDGKGYEGIGFSDFKANDYWKKEPERDSIGVCAARKTIYTNTGDKYTLIALPIRGGGYEAEWASNLTLGESGDHEGFADARDKVLNFLDSYISGLNLSDDEKNIKLWITGYSRAGATANMLAGKLDSGNHKLPDNVKITIDDIYCYTFEAPQGAIPDGLFDDFSNIHNIRNLTDVVPLVAPKTWFFRRYNCENDYIIPSGSTTKSYDEMHDKMLEELNRLGYGKEHDFEEKFVLKRKKKKFSGPYIDTIPITTEWIDIGDGYVCPDLANCIAFLAKNLFISRENYKLKYQRYISEILEYGMKENQDFLSKLLETLKNNADYLLSPLLESGDKSAKIRERIKTVVNNELYSYSKEIREDVIKVLSIATDTMITNFTEEKIWDALLFIDLIISELDLKSHNPEPCLAWCRSLDPEYNSEIKKIYYPSSRTTRVIKINCPVDVNVYDSQNNLVASIVNDVCDESIDDLFYCINENDEKEFYLPADESYTLDIVATDNGYVNYSISEYNFAYQQNTRLQNCYDIPVNKGDVLSAFVPEISEEEIILNDINGSSADYAVYHNGDKLEFDEKFTGVSIEDEYYNVTIDKEGNGGYVIGSGEFLRGSFAKVEAHLFPNAEFLGWYNNDELVSEDPEYRFAVTADTSLTAKFSDIKYSEVSFKSDGNGTVKASDGTYPSDIKIKIEAYPDEGYEFVSWTTSNGGEFKNPEEAMTEFLLDTDTVVVANFRKTESKTGDIDRNGKINIKDSVMLARYITELNSVEIDKKAADINGDGKINAADIIILRKYLVGGWDIELK